MGTMIDESMSKQLNKMSHELANFVAMYEQSDARFKTRKEEMDQQISTMKNEMQTQLSEIRTALNEISEVMTAAGAARWRIAAEKLMNHGEEHLTAIKEACTIYKKLAEDSTSRLEHVSVATEKRISNALHRLSSDNSTVVEDFRRKAENSYDQLQETTSNTIETIKRLLRWMRFDRIFIGVVAALLSAFLTAIYVNAEMPWVSHQKAKQERVIGKTLLAVWPTLPKAKQDEIDQLLGRVIQ